MLIYEVNLVISKQREEEFIPWLRKHIQEMLGLDCFIKAELYRTELQNYTCHYFCKDQETLDGYLNTYASKMREEGVQLFGDHLSANRRVLLKI